MMPWQTNNILNITLHISLYLGKPLYFQGFQAFSYSPFLNPITAYYSITRYNFTTNLGKKRVKPIQLKQQHPYKKLSLTFLAILFNLRFKSLLPSRGKRTLIFFGCLINPLQFCSSSKFSSAFSHILQTSFFTYMV